MAVRSMTGYGAARTTSSGWSVRVECRSVNHRGLDTRVYVPRSWSWLEPVVLSALKARAHRGRVEVRIDAEIDDEAGPANQFIDPVRFEAVAAELRHAAVAAGLVGDVSLSDVLTFREVVGPGEAAGPEEGDEAIVAAVERALDDLAASRRREGEALTETMLELIDEVGRGVAQVAAQVDPQREGIRARLEARAREAFAAFSGGDLDEARLLHEVVFYADRADVAEELQRAASHVETLRAMLRADDGRPRGKEIDFYLQELVREANTMGSKSASAEMTDVVIGVKSAIEKMREQAANIE